MFHRLSSDQPINQADAKGIAGARRIEHRDRIRGDAFNAAYREAFGADQAIADIATIETLCRGFARMGLTRNDVVIGVGSQRIPSLRTLRGLAGVRPRQLVLVVADGQGTRYVLID